MLSNAATSGYRADSWTCDPVDNQPTIPPGRSCEWWYEDGNYSVRYVLTASSDVDKSTAWEPLNACACGWYSSTQPCPACPPDTVSSTVTDTGMWSITVGNQVQHGFALRTQLFGDAGYTCTLTQTEQSSLSATHTESTTITLQRQQLLCFKRYYRKAWTQKIRKEKMYLDWNFWWQSWCDGTSTGSWVMTNCTQLGAIGSFQWNTYPSIEWAPQQPPCGGVPIQAPDPWGGVRESPCCQDVCAPPPSPAHPCCGCEASH